MDGDGGRAGEMSAGVVMGMEGSSGQYYAFCSHVSRKINSELGEWRRQGLGG